MPIRRSSVSRFRSLTDNSLPIITVATSVISSGHPSPLPKHSTPIVLKRVSDDPRINSLNFRNAIILLLFILPRLIHQSSFVICVRWADNSCSLIHNGVQLPISLEPRKRFGKHCLTGFRYRYDILLCFSAIHLTFNADLQKGPSATFVWFGWPSRP